VSTSLTWEAQLLAELNYLPLTFTPATTQSDPAQQVNGTFTWAYPNLPTTLSSQWRLGSDNAILRGAVMTFQSQSSLPTTGEADATTWSDLLSAVAASRVDPVSYNYVEVAMTSPEILTLYVAGHVRFHTLVNTGISVAPTATGTYPVYVRYLTTTMSGTNPDGSHYSDSGIPWVSYFNGGDALHGFIRSTYGWPQSLGCVEMTFASAQTVFPFTPIGTLDTVRS
jgi:peptidoglycan hydrolase-like protein with peptidoglycan-binding domain